MNVKQEIDGLRRDIKAKVDRIKWLRANAEKLEPLPQGRFCGSTLDFDNMPHAEVIKIIRKVGGKWKKTPSAGQLGRIDYVATIDGVEFRCWQGEPPPSCRVIEVEEMVPAVTIPASVRKVKKMVCSPDLAATIAHAAAKGVNEAVNP